MAVAGFVCGEFCFLRVVGLEVHGVVAGGGGVGLGLGDLDCEGEGGGRKLAGGFAVGVCGSTGGVGVFQVCEFFRGEFEGGAGGGGLGTGVDDAEYPFAGRGEFLHFSGDQLSGLGL